MKTVWKISAVLAFLIVLFSCEKIQKYPDIPSVEYKAFDLYQSQDALGNNILLGELKIDFTDGDGDIGLEQPDSAASADSLKYNLFLTLWAYQNNQWAKVEDDANVQNFRIPYIERTGQNKTLKGTITLELEYKTIQYDTIRYTFYITDRQLHKSNVDTTETIIFTGLDLSF
jgi:hypothetical protein